MRLFRFTTPASFSKYAGSGDAGAEEPANTVTTESTNIDGDSGESQGFFLGLEASLLNNKASPATDAPCSSGPVNYQDLRCHMVTSQKRGPSGKRIPGGS